MKSLSSTSIVGAWKEPIPSETRVKVAFDAQRRPPTLDDIFEAVKTDKLMASPNVKELFRTVIVPKDGTAPLSQNDFASHVEQFNFGALNASAIREAEKEGHDFIHNGLFQLPYPVCLYRCQVHWPNEKPIGIALLLVDANYESDLLAPDERGKGYAAVCFTHDHSHMTAMHSINTLETRVQSDGIAVQIEVPTNEAVYWRKTASTDTGEFVGLRDMAEGSLMAIGLTMILNTKNIRKERTAPPEKPNKMRARQGKPLLPWVTRVYTSVYNRAVAPGEGTHASPRPHRRRAHVRHYPATAYREAYVKPVAACLVNWDGKPLERGQYEVHGDD